MSTEELLPLIRSLKGAPASVLLVMQLTGEIMTNRDLQQWTGYGNEAITLATRLLTDLGLLTARSMMGPWALSGKSRLAAPRRDPVSPASPRLPSAREVLSSPGGLSMRGEDLRGRNASDPSSGFSGTADEDDDPPLFDPDKPRTDMFEEPEEDQAASPGISGSGSGFSGTPEDDDDASALDVGESSSGFSGSGSGFFGTPGQQDASRFDADPLSSGFSGSSSGIPGSRSGFSGTAPSTSTSSFPRQYPEDKDPGLALGKYLGPRTPVVIRPLTPGELDADEANIDLNSPERRALLEVMAELDIREPARSRLARMPHVTADYVRAHVAKAEMEGQKIGAAIWRMMHKRRIRLPTGHMNYDQADVEAKTRRFMEG